ncbi:DUF4364 family protein [Clostridia bacterium OttesenSCG-928-O13]|nr:DUF4364 family protein [Clostridia bacterium OttesenSCG-928-O13]
MATETFNEGVKPGGLTTSTEIRILLCYLLDSVDSPVSRSQVEEALLGEELVNYFAMAESLSQLRSQGLIDGDDSGYTITDAGRTVARTLAQDVPRTVRDAAIRGVIRAQQYASKAAAHRCEIEKTAKGRVVHCSIGDEAGSLFELSLYMPNDLSAQAVRDMFVEHGDGVYKLVLAALTGNRTLAEKALNEIQAVPEE